MPRVERLARLRSAPRHHHRANVIGLENPEWSVREVGREFRELEPKPQVRLVGAEPRHGLRERDARDGSGDLVANQRPQLLDDFFAKRDHVVLVHKRHLNIELGELRLAIRAEVLIAIAAGDLVVPLHACDHQQLLEKLRRLRQRVPGSGRKPGGNQEVARALRRGARQRWRLDLEEVVAVKDATRGSVGL